METRGLFQSPPNSRSTAGFGWGRLLETIVHIGMVVAMASFLLIDLIAFARTGWSAWLLVGTGLLAAAVTIVMRHHPLPGLALLAGVSLVISFGGLATRVVLGLEMVDPGFGEVAGIAILASAVARRLPTTRVIIGVGSAYAVTARSPVSCTSHWQLSRPTCRTCR